MIVNQQDVDMSKGDREGHCSLEEKGQGRNVRATPQPKQDEERQDTRNDDERQQETKTFCSHIPIEAALQINIAIVGSRQRR